MTLPIYCDARKRLGASWHICIEEQLNCINMSSLVILQFPYGACTQAIVANPDDSRWLSAMSDPRKDGAPAVY